ncbi:peptidoglycan bridge formation glycyltransferase FemA/FemB family protein [Candidatus Woesebacteria bacterium]|nr:peptidoglycan bridge formation glycyltransferase FemA/FemB family protein [Candidatus Woesebacteria bacterium]
MRYTIKPIEEQSEWEWFMLRHSPVALFQSWLWGEVQKKSGEAVWRYGVYDKKTLRGVFMMIHVRAKRGSFLHVRHGPVLDSFDHDLWESVLDYLRQEGKKLGCYFVRVGPLVFESEETRAWEKSFHLIPAAIHHMDSEYCWALDLAPSEDELLSTMRKTTRYEIRRAQKENVEVIKTTNATYISEFFDLYKATSTRHGFVPHHGIAEEFEVYAKKQQAVLYIGKHEGKTLAAAIILYYGNQAIYHHGASISSHVPASTLVQWEAIKDAKKRGMNVYNFWGIAPENSPKHPWRGITLFKKGFGGRDIEYIHAHDMPISPLYVIPRAIETIRRILRGYN